MLSGTGQLRLWALRDGEPVWLALQEAPASGGGEPSPAQAARVETVTAEELDRNRVWIGNWLSLLPYLSTTAWIDLQGLREPVAAFFWHEASFDDAERHFARFDPVLVRTAVIAGLHQGRLFSGDLFVRPVGSSSICHFLTFILSPAGRLAVGLKLELTAISR